MCQIILNTQGILPKEQLFNSFENNSDSAGIAYIKNGKVVIEKIIPEGNVLRQTDHDRLYNMYLSARNLHDKMPVLIHTRIATGGGVNKENAHPYRVSPTMAFAHNGIISELSFSKSKYCDTWHLNSFFKRLYKSSPDFLEDDAVYAIIEALLGTSNKLAFIFADGSYEIIGEKYGSWSDDNHTWYSNNSHCQVSGFVWYGNTRKPRAGTKGFNLWDDEDDIYSTYNTASKDTWDMKEFEGYPYLGSDRETAQFYFEKLRYMYRASDLLKYLDKRFGVSKLYLGEYDGSIWVFDLGWGQWFQTSISTEFFSYYAANTIRVKFLSNYIELFPTDTYETQFHYEDGRTLRSLFISTLPEDIDPTVEAYADAYGIEPKTTVN